MKKLGKLLLGLLVVGIPLGAVGYVVFQLYDWLASLDQSAIATVFGTISILIVPVVTYFTTKRLEQRKLIDESTRERKIETYVEIIDLFMNMMNLGKRPEGGIPEGDMPQLFESMTKKLLSYGSNNVISKWSGLRSYMNKYDSDDPAQQKVFFLKFEQMIKAMRKDIGHGSGAFMQQGSILGLWINDVDTILKR